MKTKLNQLIAFVIAMCILMLNFMPVISFAVDVTNLNLQGNETNIKDVKFDVYFAEGKHEFEKVVGGEEETIIYAMVKVEDGYLDNSQIDFSNCNFNVELLEENDFVEGVEGNIIKLNKAGKGEEKIVKLKVVEKELNEVQGDSLYRVSHVNISGKYINGEGNEEKLVSSKDIKLSWTAAAEENLEVEISKYLPIVTDAGSMLMVQEKIRTNLVGDKMPIKETNLSIVIPEIANELPEEIRVTGETGATNGDDAGSLFDIQNYSYDLDAKLVEISTENKADEKGNISWKKGLADEYLVTYIYSEDVLNSVKDTGTTININVVGNMTLADEKSSLVEKEINADVALNGDIGSIVDAKAEISGKISKGYMITNTKAMEENRKETEYKVSYEVEVGYSELIDGLDIEVTKDKFGLNDYLMELENSTYIKEISLVKEDILKIIGESGALEIKSDDQAIYTINNSTEAREDGKIVLDVSQMGVDHLSILSNSIEQEGKIKFEVLKAVKPSIEISTNEVNNMSSIVAGIEVKANNEENKIAEVDSEGAGELEGTVSKANISTDREALSTLLTNEDVKITALLETNSSDDTLYTNPEVEIKLPDTFEKIENIEANLYFDDELRITDGRVVDNEDGTKSIRIKLEGTQTKYNMVSSGSLLEIKSDITLDTLSPMENQTIKMVLLNETDGSTTEATTEVETVSLPGLSLSIESKEQDGNVAISSIDNKLLGGLKVSQGKKNIEVKTTILNNSEVDYENMVVLGRFLVAGNTEIETGESLESTINTSIKDTYINVKSKTEELPTIIKYYSKNANATTDLADANNGWTTERSEEDKSYMLVAENGGKLAIGSSIVYTYNVEVPANLEYNESVYGQYALYSSNNETVYSEVYGYTTGNGPELKATLTSDTKENTVLDTGKVVKYTLNVQNTGVEDAENVVANIIIPEGMELVEKNTTGYELSAKAGEYKFIITEDELEEEELPLVDKNGNLYRFRIAVPIELGTIKGNESATCEVYMRAKAISEATDIETIAVVNSNDLRVRSNPIQNRIESKFFNYTVSSDSDFNSIEVGEENIIAISIYSTDYEVPREKTVLTINLPNELSYAGYELKAGTKKIEDNVLSQSGNKLTFNLGSISSEGATIKLIVKGNDFSDSYSKNVNMTASVSCEGNSNGEKIEIPQITVNRPGVNLIQTSVIQDKSEIKEGENFSYTYTITKKSNANIGNATFTAKLPEGVTYLSTNYRYDNGELANMISVDGEGNPNFGVALVNENSIEITLNVRVGNLSEDLTAVSYATLTSDKIGEVKSNELTHYLKNVGANKSDSGSTVDGDGNGSGNVNPGSRDQGNTENSHRISGLVWRDLNSNGQRDSNETSMSGVRVLLMNSDTGNVAKNNSGTNMITTTDSTGTYTFSNLAYGKYSVVFLYNSGEYSATAYQVSGVSATNNSDAIDTTVQYQGKSQIAAVINSINLSNENIFNMDLGLVTKQNFDLRLEKTVSSISVTTKEGTSTYNYGTNFAKVDVAAKDQNNATIVVSYKLKVINEGKVEGKVNSLVDKIPQGLEFSSSLNSDWYAGNDRNIYNDTVSNTVLKPGDSIEVSLVLTKRMNSNGYGLLNNSAEINKASNDLGLSDIDSLPGNNSATEDDYSNADVLISVKTGQMRNYAVLFIMSAMILFVGTFIIRKNVMKGDEING